MPSFSQISTMRLITCHPDIVLLCNEIIKDVDISVLCGHRGQDEQNRAYELGRSTKRWPNSKHNLFPSMAVDIGPYPIDWDNRDRWTMFGGYVLWRAGKLGLNVRWGGDWDSDGDIWEHRFIDMPHFEVVG